LPATVDVWATSSAFGLLSSSLSTHFLSDLTLPLVITAVSMAQG
jgi:hypothetical protein